MGVYLELPARPPLGVTPEVGDVIQIGVSGRMLAALAGILALSIGWALAARRGGGAARQLSGPAWTGGAEGQTPAPRWTGEAFGALVWLPFSRSDRPGSAAAGAAIPRPEAGAGPPAYLPERHAITAARWIIDPFCWVYNRLLGGLIAVSQRLGDSVQSGDIRRYLFYIFSVFVALLLALLFIIPYIVESVSGAGLD
jgi:hypothetical protein